MPYRRDRAAELRRERSRGPHRDPIRSHRPRTARIVATPAGVPPLVGQARTPRHRQGVHSTTYAPGVQRRNLGICRSHRACISSLAVASLLLGLGAIGVDRAVATDRSGTPSAPGRPRHVTVPADVSVSLAARDPDGSVIQGRDKRPRFLRPMGMANDGWLAASALLFVVGRKRRRGPGLGVPLFVRGSVPRAPPASLHF
jgi:hypothetical protein